MKRPATVAVVAGCVLAMPALAHAHPRLESSTPSPSAVLAGSPASVELRFNEDVDPVGEGVRITDPAGRPVAAGPVRQVGRSLIRAIDGHARGTYVVEWMAVGPDTHPARGAFVFSVGEPARAAVPGASRTGIVLQALGRWLSLAGFALGFGLTFACVAARRQLTPRLWRLVALGIGLMLVAEPVSLLGQTATLQPSHAFSLQLAGDVLLTSYGHVTGLRLGGALALWALAGAVRQATSPRLLWAIPAVGGALAVVHADAAHRISGIPAALSVALAALHVAAAGAWLGFVLLAFFGGAVSRRLVQFAIGATGVLVLSGAGLAVGQLTAIGNLVETSYGEALFVKVGVVAVALLLGGLGRRRAELVAAASALAGAAVLVSLLPPG